MWVSAEMQLRCVTHSNRLMCCAGGVLPPCYQSAHGFEHVVPLEALVGVVADVNEVKLGGAVLVRCSAPK